MPGTHARASMCAAVALRAVVRPWLCRSGCPPSARQRRRLLGGLRGASTGAAAQVAPGHVEAYARDGVVHLPGVFDAAGLRALREAFRIAMEHPGVHAEYIGQGVTWQNLFAAGASERAVEMFQDQLFFEEAQERAPGWAEIIRASPAAEIIAQLMRSTTAAYFYAHLILKRGGASQAVPWHQDLPYWKVEGRQIGSVWIALDDMPAAAGVRYLRGSHRWGLFRPRHFVDASPYDGRDELPLLPDVDAMLASEEAEALVFDVAAGDVVCFDARTVHGSPGNPEVEGRDHRRVAFRFCGDDARYCERPGESAIPTPEVEAVHGLRHGDAMACRAFPQVWPL